jgi:hypothetical protein
MQLKNELRKHSHGSGETLIAKLGLQHRRCPLQLRCCGCSNAAAGCSSSHRRLQQGQRRTGWRRWKEPVPREMVACWLLLLWWGKEATRGTEAAAFASNGAGAARDGRMRPSHSRRQRLTPSRMAVAGKGGGGALRRGRSSRVEEAAAST